MNLIQEILKFHFTFLEKFLFENILKNSFLKAKFLTKALVADFQNIKKSYKNEAVNILSQVECRQVLMRGPVSNGTSPINGSFFIFFASFIPS